MKQRVLILSIIAIILLLSSCTSSKTLTLQEVRSLQTNKNHLILHTQTEKYSLVNYSFLGDNLVGDLTSYRKPKGETIHFHTLIAYNIELHDNQVEHMVLDLSHINKVEYQKPAPGKTIGLIATPFAVVFAAGLIALSGFTMN